MHQHIFFSSVFHCYDVNLLFNSRIFMIEPISTECWVICIINCFAYLVVLFAHEPMINDLNTNNKQTNLYIYIDSSLVFIFIMLMWSFRFLIQLLNWKKFFSIHVIRTLVLYVTCQWLGHCAKLWLWCIYVLSASRSI